MATGGLVLKDLSNEDRTGRNLPQNALALLVEYVGQYNEHAVGKRAGFQKNDIIVRVDSQADRMTESELFRYLLQNKAKDERASVTILRDNAQETLSLPLQ
jgi:S1-C subfamily serine protease